MIYHYMGAEIEIVKLLPKQMLVVKTIGTEYESEHHISELKAENGVEEINQAISKLDISNSFWNV